MKTTSEQAKGIRAMTGLSQRAFAEKYQIPRRTIEDWETGRGAPPDYVLNMLERIVLEDMKEQSG